MALQCIYYHSFALKMNFKQDVGFVYTFQKTAIIFQIVDIKQCET